MGSAMSRQGPLIESAAVRRRHRPAFVGMLVTGTALAVIAWSGVALAQAPPDVTPNPSITPTKTVQPWIYQMAIGAVILGVLILIGLALSYMRYSPKFFGREEASRPAPPGTRPRMLARQAAAHPPRTSS